MEQFFAAFIHRSQAYQRGPKLETDIQLGDEVSVWIGTQSTPDSAPALLALPGVLVGVRIVATACTFDVAFQIGDTDIFGVAHNVVSHITLRGEQYNPLGLPEGANEGQGGDGQGPAEATKPPPKPGLRLAVHNKDTQLASDEAAANATAAPALSVVSGVPINKRFETIDGPGMLTTEAGRQIMAEALGLVVEYPMAEMVLMQMTFNMPEGASVVGEPDRTSFKVEYASPDTAQAELERFQLVFPHLKDQVRRT